METIDPLDTYYRDTYHDYVAPPERMLVETAKEEAGAGGDTRRDPS
jgi:hypothetical protein